MKAIRLSLVAALAAGVLGTASSAATLDEAVKGIDLSGFLRYRYDTGTFGQKNTMMTEAAYGQNDSKQMHKYYFQLNFKGAVADNFEAFAQLAYGESEDGGYGIGTKADTSTTPLITQLYLSYTVPDIATTLTGGRQLLTTIWNDNSPDGGVIGTALKLTNASIEGLTIQGLLVDSFNLDSDLALTQNKGTNFPGGNLYALGLTGSWDVGGTYAPQLWAGYLEKVGTFYAVSGSYSLPLGEGLSYTAEAAYLGNALNKDTASLPVVSNGNGKVKNGYFAGARGTIEADGIDATLGGVIYGHKNSASFVVIEDQGDIGSLLAGQEIFYSNGSHLNGDIGRNVFGYLTAGYTFDEVLRVGGDLVYGVTSTAKSVTTGEFKGKKFEAVARVDYAYTPKLSFGAFYSYLNVSTGKGNAGKKGDHQTIRLQALYNF